jgi:hypothetical protein
MERKYILQDAISKKYWYGHYTSKHWTEDILEAFIFDFKSEVKDFISNNEGELEGMFIVEIRIWK